MHTYIHTYVPLHVHTLIYTRANRTYTPLSCVYTYGYMYVNMHITPSRCTCTYIHIPTCIHAHAHTCSIACAGIVCLRSHKIHIHTPQSQSHVQVLAVSDPTADRSAASMDVSVGHFSDPDELPGLAHFLEHMLFMGSKKYPGMLCIRGMRMLMCMHNCKTWGIQTYVYVYSHTYTYTNIIRKHAYAHTHTKICI
jgi:hypothetical protein